MLILALVLSGCAQAPKVFHYRGDARQTVAKVWPEPPEKPRYRYLGQLTGEENFRDTVEAKPNVGIRFFYWLVGWVRHTPGPVILQRPQSGTVGADGRIFVSDVSRQAVYVFDPGAKELLVWEYAASGVRFELPIGVAVDRAGHLWVADSKLGYVVQLNAAGQPMSVVGQDRLQHPTGVAWDEAAGRLYVADRADSAIKVFSAAGEFLFEFGGPGEKEGLLNGPTYLSFRDNTLYVTDSLNSRIQLFSAAGEFQRAFGHRGMYLGDFSRPKGVAADRDGNIYVVESLYDYLLVFNNKGELLLPLGGTGQDIGQFYLPAGAWVDNNGWIYVADMFNGRVVIFQYLGDGNGDAVEGGDTADAKHAAGR
ncbi:MAG: 6-bladed beta-propeller [Gammaproteobacteria bacterium]|nr:6-bladed beta-propeller [Gammaproteobacteria bacterium]